MTINEALTQEEDGFFIDYPHPFGNPPDGYEFIGKVRPVREVRPKKVAPTFSAYARIFDADSENWVKDSEMNRLFLQCQENYANHLLHARGHVFLNEIYDMLGLGRSPVGAIVGWLMEEVHDNKVIDFGLTHPENVKFLNGLSGVVVLDFNVDGVIYEKI